MGTKGRSRGRVNRFKNADASALAPKGFLMEQGLIEVRAFFQGKHSEPGRETEDAFRFDVKRGVVAISDGASTSYRANLWSDMIVEELITKVTTPFDDIDWANLAERVRTEYPTNEPFFVRSLQNEGSAATALRAVVEKRDDSWRVSVENIGDGLMVLVEVGPDNTNNIVSWPYSTLAEFPVAPSAYSSSAPHRRGGAPDSANFFCGAGDQMLLMTDALARYFCRIGGHSRTINEVFPFLESPKTFRSWSIKAIDDEILEDDDLTLVAVRIL